MTAGQYVTNSTFQENESQAVRHDKSNNFSARTSQVDGCCREQPPTPRASGEEQWLLPTNDQQVGEIVKANPVKDAQVSPSINLNPSRLRILLDRFLAQTLQDTGLELDGVDISEAHLFLGRSSPFSWQGFGQRVIHHSCPLQLDQPVLVLPSSAHQPCHGLPREC